jgi:hypothetical protein
MESKGVLTEDGFTIEVAIPFKSLRYEAGKEQTMGTSYQSAGEIQQQRIQSWMPDDRSVSGWLHKAGHITGS